MGKGNILKYANQASRSFGDNKNELERKFPKTDGLFGTKGNSSKDSVRHINCKNPQKAAEEFYRAASKGGTETHIDGGKGMKSVMKDYVIVIHRVTSSSDGSPAIDINPKQSGVVKAQKIHFVKKGK